MRLVFISLDTGGSKKEPKREFGADLIEHKKDIQAQTYRCANPHMRGTIKTLRHLYGRDDRDSDLLKRFAMTNSAKCSGKESAGMVPDQLYDNCKGHGIAELNELDPQLIVTQGVKAREMLNCLELEKEELKKNMPSVSTLNCMQVKKHLKCWKMDNQEEPVWVLQCPHPSSPSWHEFKRTMLPTLAHVLRRRLPALGKLR